MDYEEKKKQEDGSVAKNSMSLVKNEKILNVTVEENSVKSNASPELVNKLPNKTPKKIVAKKSLPKTPVTKSGLHNCHLCNGSNKDGQALSLKDLPRLKEHYTKCLYNESKYVKFVPPGENNVDEIGNPVNENSAMYRCEIKGCWLQKKAGEKGKISYKVLAHHMASQHGVLEKILEVDHRPFMKELLKEMKEAEQSKPAIVGCKFKQCSKIQFKADNKREIKLHYASAHFSEWFSVNPQTGVPENFSKSGNRAICDTCTGSSDKPVYVQGEKEAIRGHLVVKHDMLADILIKAREKIIEAREVISDLYPDKLTEV